MFGAIRGTIAQWLFEPKTIDLKIVARSLVENTRRSLAVNKQAQRTSRRIRASKK